MNPFKVLKGLVSAKGASSQWDKTISVKKANTVAKDSAIGFAGSGGAFYALLAFIRTVNPNLIPWPIEFDGDISAFVAFFGGPFWAWLKTYISNKRKHAAQMDGGEGKPLIPLIIAMMLVLGGCITTKSPEGVIITQVDKEGAVVLAQLALNSTKELFAEWERIQAREQTLSAEEYARERERRLEQLAVLEKVLNNLMEKKNAEY